MIENFQSLFIGNFIWVLNRSAKFSDHIFLKYNKASTSSSEPEETFQHILIFPLKFLPSHFGRIDSVDRSWHGRWNFITTISPLRKKFFIGIKHVVKSDLFSLFFYSSLWENAHFLLKGMYLHTYRTVFIFKRMRSLSSVSVMIQPFACRLDNKRKRI